MNVDEFSGMFQRLIDPLKLIRQFRFSCVHSKPKQRNISSVAQRNMEEVNHTYRFVCDKIRSGGPITVHEFMQICAGGPAGYYSQNKEIFGAKGDFVTAPELSQMFGEAIAVWITAELQNTGHRGYWQLVEFGAGTGTLMHDIVRALTTFKVRNFSIHLIETSETLMERQKKKLRVRANPNPRKVSKAAVKAAAENGDERKRAAEEKPSGERAMHGLPIFWHRSIDELPEKFSVFIANEFLDALPIHQFQRINPSPNRIFTADCDITAGEISRTGSSNDWREVYVNLNEENRLCLMLSKGENIHTKGLIPDYIRNDVSRSHWEACPNAADVVGRVVHRFTYHGGFALFIDYGHDGMRLTPSLRAYRDHKIADFLEPDAAGQVDLTADVDFGHLRRVLQDSCLMFGPVPQQSFLLELGVLHRLRILMANCETDEERECLHKSFKMLMGSSDGKLSSDDSSNDGGGMGTAFKAFALFPNTLAEIMEKRGGAPIGFQTLLTAKTNSSDTNSNR